jgi:hypothetical protein
MGFRQGGVYWTCRPSLTMAYGVILHSKQMPMDAITPAISIKGIFWNKVESNVGRDQVDHTS